MPRNFTISIVENGYVVYEPVPNGAETKAHVARTPEELVEITKVVEVTARLDPPKVAMQQAVPVPPPGYPRVGQLGANSGPDQRALAKEMARQVGMDPAAIQKLWGN